MKTEKTKSPMWFTILSIFFLLWNCMGVLSFLAHTLISDEALAKLPADQQALYNDFPLWTTIAFALAVFPGFIGSVGLLMKKKWSKTAFLISLLAIIPQMTYNVFFTKSMEVYGTVETITMPILVVTLGVFVLWFSMMGTRKQWLN